MAENSTEFSDFDLEKDQIRNILDLMQIIDDGDMGEHDLELEVFEAVVEYLEDKIDFSLEEVEIGVIDYDAEEITEREIVFDDHFLAVSVDEIDEDTGEKAYAVWVRRDFFD